MGVYDGKHKEELQEIARTRGLAVSGTNPELTARLEQYDTEHAGDDDLLTGLDNPPPPPPAEPSTPPQTAAPASAPNPSPAAPAQPAAAPDEPAPPPKTIDYTYPCPGELSTGVHEDNRVRAYHQAVTDGYIPRGGLAGVHRSGWAQKGDGRHAVYTVTLRKPQ